MKKSAAPIVHLYSSYVSVETACGCAVRASMRVTDGETAEEFASVTCGRCRRVCDAEARGEVRGREPCRWRRSPK